MSLVPTFALALAAIGEPSVGEGIGLEWTAPSSCPQESEVREAIDLNLARDVFSEQLATVEVHGAIEETNGGWVLRVRTELPSGRVERAVESVECAELAAAAGLIIAVALDPLRVVETVTANVAPATADEPPPTLEPRPRPQAEAPTRERHWSFDLRLGLLGEIGSLTVPRAGVWAGAGVKTKRVRFDVAGQYWGPRR
ncbi:MAG: hypothetical protein JKY37_33885, partial [Nannocystaceae bacterium]|nr:hypothetical protein [Nannocystaceae bacterium]